MKPRAPTKRQAEVLSFIREFRRRNGYPPSRPEIAQALGLADHTSILPHLIGLQNRGWLDLIPNTGRGIRLREDYLPVVRLGPIHRSESIHDQGRIVGRIAAQLGEELVPDACPSYFATISDRSMDALGLRPGDRVAVREQDEPEDEDGRVVVARVDNELLLRRYRTTDNGQVELLPESTTEHHRTLGIDPARTAFRVEGVVVGALIGIPRL